MRKMQSNHFEFVNANSDKSTMVLHATMSDFSYVKHAHEELTLAVTTCGIQEFYCKGSWFRSHPGEIILLNPGDVHNGNPGNNDILKYTMLYLDTEDFYPLMWSATGSQHRQFRIAQNHFKDPALQSLILGLSNIVGGRNCFAVEFDHCRYKIARHLALRMCMATLDSWKKEKDKLLLKAKEYIHDNVTEDISIDELSQIVNISKYHFIRMFRNQFGLTPHQYILNLKVNQARISLETEAFPSEVAQHFGFFDVSHLNRHFKRVVGLTPKQYQQQLKQ